MSVSIHDIARRAQVSASTVSRALQNNPRIGVRTRARIHALAAEMSYVPSDIARSLVTHRTRTIGVLVPAIADPFMGRVIEGIEQAALENGHTVLIGSTQNDPDRERLVINTMRARRVDGVIVMTSHMPSRVNTPGADDAIPLVLFNEQSRDTRTPVVAVDDLRSAEMAVASLIDLGHRDIAYVGVTDRARSNQSRLRGYRQALKTARIAARPTLVIRGRAPHHEQLGFDALSALQQAGATAAFCYNDSVAIGLLAACAAQGVRVPRDLSVIGFDDIDTARFTSPPLSTVRQPRFELGRRAVHMLLRQLNGGERERYVTLGQLIIRESTRAPGTSARAPRRVSQ
jgi:DNA-binding LacI/PurR family transcriptional regulator